MEKNARSIFSLVTPMQGSKEGRREKKHPLRSFHCKIGIYVNEKKLQFRRKEKKLFILQIAGYKKANICAIVIRKCFKYKWRKKKR